MRTRVRRRATLKLTTLLVGQDHRIWRTARHRRQDPPPRQTPIQAIRRVTTTTTTELPSLCLELGLPAVTLGRPDQPSPFPAVCLDDRAGVAAAVRHLAELGHERIAHVAGPQGVLHGTHRRRAWESAMREVGLEPHLLEVADFTAAQGAAATRALLGGAERPTAIAYANDVMAMPG